MRVTIAASSRCSMPSSVQSRGAEALARARSQRVNTITVKNEAQSPLASSLLHFCQSSLPASKCAMNDSQETRLPSSPENSEVEDNESPQDVSQLSSVVGTPREQWDHSTQRHFQQHCHVAEQQENHGQQEASPQSH